jgi:cyanuric acid amidohydrolase
MSNPGDTAALEALIDGGALKAEEIVAIFGKTEGNGCVNDFTRPYAIETLKGALAPRLGCSREDVSRRIGMVMSGGTEGGLSPHFLIFAVRAGQSPARPGKRLAIGAPFSRRRSGACRRFARQRPPSERLSQPPLLIRTTTCISCKSNVR